MGLIQGGWDTENQIFANFEAARPDDFHLVYAEYDHQDYEGNARVVYISDGKWYEVHGSHCSCYGLEGQWRPEETSFEAIMRYKYWSNEAVAAFYNAYQNPPKAQQYRYYNVSELRKYETRIWAPSAERALEIYEEDYRWSIGEDNATIAKVQLPRLLDD